MRLKIDALGREGLIRIQASASPRKRSCRKGKRVRGETPTEKNQKKVRLIHHVKTVSWVVGPETIICESNGQTCYYRENTGGEKVSFGKKRGRKE